MNYSNFLSNVSEVKITYHNKVKASERPKITSSINAYEILKNIWSDVDYLESFYILMLNRANALLGISKISQGSTTASLADPKVIFQLALKTNSSGIILAHNHPSGNLEPSSSDRNLTEKIKNAGKFLDISVLDHLILTSEAYKSFADNGLM
jgi:DNA repair protein RadC